MRPYVECDASGLMLGEERVVTVGVPLANRMMRAVAVVVVSAL